MNKKEWKANHTAARFIYSGYIAMISNKHGARNAIAQKLVWESIDALGMQEVIWGKSDYLSYPLRANKWAVKHNCRNY